MKLIYTLTVIVNIFNCYNIGVFLEKTPRGMNQQDYYIHLHFKKNTNKNLIQNDGQTYQDNILVYKVPHIYIEAQNNTNNKNGPNKSQKKIYNLEDAIINMRVCYKDKIAKRVKCFKKPEIDFMFNSLSQKTKFEVDLKRKRICAYGTLLQYSQYFYNQGLYKQSIEAYWKNIEALSAPEFEKQMLKYILQEMQNVHLGYTEQIKNRESYYRNNLCSVDFENEFLQPQDFTGEIFYSVQQNSNVERRVVDFYLMIKQPTQAQILNNIQNQLKLQAKQKAIQRMNNVMAQTQGNKPLQNNLDTQIQKKVQTIKVQLQIKDNKQSIYVEPQTGKNTQREFVSINTFNITNICNKYQQIQLLIMHCDIYAPSKKNFLLQEEVFSTDECKLLKNSQNLDAVQICRQPQQIQQYNRAITLSAEYFVIQETVDIKEKTNDDFEIAQDGLLETCDYILDTQNKQLIVRCYDQMKLKIKTKLGFNKEFKIHKNFQPLQNRFTLENYYGSNASNNLRRRILKIQASDVFFLLFLAFIIGVLIAILISVAMSGVFFVLLIIVVVMLCVYFLYRLATTLDKQRRVLEGIFDQKIQMKGKDLYEKMTPLQKQLIYEEINILQNLTQSLIQPIYQNQNLKKYGIISYQQLQQKLKEMEEKHEIIFGEGSQQQSQQSIQQQRIQAHQNKIGNINQKQIEQELQKAKVELKKIQDDITRIIIQIITIQQNILIYRITVKSIKIFAKMYIVITKPVY